MQTRQSSLPLLGGGPGGRFMEGGGLAQVADLLCVTDTTVHAKQEHRGVCASAWPKAPLCTACALLCNRESLQGWCSFPPPSEVQLALSFQEHNPLKQEREEYVLQETPETIKGGERKLSRFSLWEFFLGAPCHDRIHTSVSHNAYVHLPRFACVLMY